MQNKECMLRMLFYVHIGVILIVADSILQWRKKGKSVKKNEYAP